MSKHTPGPWVLENRGYKFIVSKPADGYTKCLKEHEALPHKDAVALCKERVK